MEEIEAISRLNIQHNIEEEKVEDRDIVLNSLAKYKNYRMKSIVWMIQEIFKMLNQYAMDILMLPVNLCLSQLIQFLVEC